MGTYISDWALARNSQNPAWRPKKGPLSVQTATYRKLKVPRVTSGYGRHDPIESNPSGSKKWGFHRCSIEKCRNLCVDPIAGRAGRLPGPIFWPKICIFLHYTYETPIFWLVRTPYPELILYNFCFPVGGRLAARRTVFWPPCWILVIPGQCPIANVPLILDRGQRNLVGPSGQPKNTLTMDLVPAGITEKRPSQMS